MQLFFIFGYIFLEIYSLILLSDYIGGLLTLLWVFGAAALGFWLIRESGRENLQRMMMGMQAGGTPQQSLLNSFFIIFAGFLLILPGVFSDLIAFFLLIPHFRRLLFGRTARFVEAKGQQFYSGNTTFFRFFGGPGFPGAYEEQDFSRTREQNFFESGQGSETMDAEYTVREQSPRKTTAVVIESEVLDNTPHDDKNSRNAPSRGASSSNGHSSGSAGSGDASNSAHKNNSGSSNGTSR